MTECLVWIAKGTWRKRILLRRAIRHDGEAIPYRITDADGTAYVRDGAPDGDWIVYVPAAWVEEPLPAGADEEDYA